MARKFDVGRATEEELRERVRTLTSALIKQVRVMNQGGRWDRAVGRGWEEGDAG